jgi:hypothetical protein
MEFPIARPATQASNHSRILTRTPMKKFGLLCILAALGCDTDKFTGISSSASNFYFVRLNPEAAAIAVGETQQLSVTAFDEGPCSAGPCTPSAPGNPITVQGTPTFRSTDTTRVTVSSTGLVSGIAVGTASVIATLQDIPGFTGGPSVSRADTTIFTVTAAPVALGNLQLSGRATGTPNTVGAGSTLALTTAITDPSGAPVTNVGRPQYYSTKPEIATVSATGVVTGVKPGNTTILATITVSGVTRTTAYDVTVTPPVATTVMICAQACQANPVGPIAFTPASITVSATQAQVQGLPGATVTFTVPTNTFTATTTPDNTQCFNVTFANPAAAGAVPPSTDSGDIGTGAAGTSNAPLCSGSRSRRFTTPGTYTYTSTTNGATGTIIVE